MKQAGQAALFRFPRSDLGEAKLRPALLLSRLPGEYDDWPICMISSKFAAFFRILMRLLERTISTTRRAA